MKNDKPLSSGEKNPQQDLAHAREQKSITVDDSPSSPPFQLQEIARRAWLAYNYENVSFTDAVTRAMLEVIQQAEADTKRLDKLEANFESNPPRRHKGRWSMAGLTNYEYDTFATLREAIDDL